MSELAVLREQRGARGGFRRHGVDDGDMSDKNYGFVGGAVSMQVPFYRPATRVSNGGNGVSSMREWSSSHGNIISLSLDRGDSYTTGMTWEPGAYRAPHRIGWSYHCSGLCGMALGLGLPSPASGPRPGLRTTPGSAGDGAGLENRSNGTSFLTTLNGVRFGTSKGLKIAITAVTSYRTKVCNRTAD